MIAEQREFFDRSDHRRDEPRKSPSGQTEVRTARSPARRRPVLPGDVDAAFVTRSVASYRANPNARYGWRRLTAEESLRASMAERRESIRAIDLVYQGELNDWAAETRERLWLEYFTARAILDGWSGPR